MTSVYIYRWNRMGRKGQRCMVLARGTMNSCWVRFEDGFEAITSRNALRKADLAIEFIEWINEDGLPKGYPYDQMFPYSKLG